MALNDAKARNAKPKAKVYRLADQHGLCLEVKPSGSKLWRYRYRFQGKATMISFGPYPLVSLAEARDKHAEARKILLDGRNPKEIKDEIKAVEQAKKETFKEIALEWHAKNAARYSESYAHTALRRFQNHVFPFIGSIPVNEVSVADLIRVMKRLEDMEIIDTAHRQLQKIGQVMRYAVRTGRADTDPTIMLKGTLPTRKTKHHSTLTDPREIAGLLRAIDGYDGSVPTRCAMQLAPLTFVRPGELRHAEWSEIDFETRQWKIPAGKMKMSRPHIVPLSRQALGVLAELRPLTGDGKYIFPGVRSRSRPMSNNTVNAALRRMGYEKDQITGHGFRSMASTLLNEMGFNRDWIERQLAHSERDEIRAAYNYAEFLPDRVRMMQSWADFLSALKEKGKVVPLRAANEK